MRDCGRLGRILWRRADPHLMAYADFMATWAAVRWDMPLVEAPSALQAADHLFYLAVILMEAVDQADSEQVIHTAALDHL